MTNQFMIKQGALAPFELIMQHQNKMVNPVSSRPSLFYLHKFAKNTQFYIALTLKLT